MKRDLLSIPSSPLPKISQMEFYHLYLQTLDDAIYRPTINGEMFFYLAKLLIDRGYAPDLSYLNLRNLNLFRADFTGLNLKKTDLRGAMCNYADFRGATNVRCITDTSTKSYGAKLTQGQLIELHAAKEESLPTNGLIDDDLISAID